MSFEKQAWQQLRQCFRKEGDRVQRVENVVAVGCPDINACCEGEEFWIEIKAPLEPKRSTTKLFGSNHKLSTEQLNWFLSQKKAGGVGFVFISTDKRCMLIDGIYADKINDLTVDELAYIALWAEYKPVRKDSWKIVRSLMVMSSRQNRLNTN